VHRLVIALTALLGLTGAAVVATYLVLSGASADRAARLVPADALAYANVYLQPSSGQQANLAALIGRLPGFADEASFDEKVDQVVQNLLSLVGLDYRAQLKPWLGDQLAVAAVPTGDAGPAAFAALVAVTDAAGAEAAAADAIAPGGEPASRDHRGTAIREAAGGAFVILDGLLVVSESPAAVEAIVDVHHGGRSLTSVPAYAEATADLPPDHVASTYLRLGAAPDEGGTATGFGAAAAALVVESDGLRIIGSAPFDAAAASDVEREIMTIASEPSSLAEWMPPDTVASAVLVGIRQVAEGAGSGSPLGDGVALARAAAALVLGMNLDRDLLPLFDRESAVAVSDLAGPVPRLQVLVRPSDPHAAIATLEAAVERLVDAGGQLDSTTIAGITVTAVDVPSVGSVAYAVVEDVIVLGLDPETVGAVTETRASGESLATSDRYRRTFERVGERAGNEAFVNVDGLVSVLGLADGLPTDVRDILAQIGGFGLATPARENEIEIRGALTVE
jgi:hypothetical protein